MRDLDRRHRRSTAFDPLVQVTGGRGRRSGGSVGGGWSRGGRSLNKTIVASAIVRTAASNGPSVFFDVELTPLTLRTY
jgi:hypothetical protein